jgi:hypothetical protein
MTDPSPKRSLAYRDVTVKGGKERDPSGTAVPLPPVRSSSTGQPAEHPGFKVAARCDELALRLYGELMADADELVDKIAAATT